MVRFQTAEPEKEENEDSMLRSDPERAGRAEAPGQMQSASTTQEPQTPALPRGAGKILGFAT